MILLFSFCRKKDGAAKPPIDVIDTTKGRMSFELNGYYEGMFHIQATKVKNKIDLWGDKTKVIDNRLVSFEFIEICFGNKTMKKQPIFDLIVKGDEEFSDSTRAWGGFYTMDDDGDAGCESFAINDKDSVNNWIKITKENNDFGEVWGNFSMSFTKTKNCDNKLYPDAVVIRNGYFHVFVK